MTLTDASCAKFCCFSQLVGGRTIAVDWAVPKAQFQSNTPAGAPTGEGNDALAEGSISDDEEDTAGEEEPVSEQEDEGANDLELEDEKKLLRNVLSQIDDGDEDEAPQPAAKVWLSPVHSNL